MLLYKGSLNQFLICQEAQPEPEAVPPTEEAAEAPSIEAASVAEAEMPWSCVECRVPLPWGTDWRQEGEDFYCH